MLLWCQLRQSDILEDEREAIALLRPSRTSQEGRNYFMRHGGSHNDIDIYEFTKVPVHV